MYGQASYLPATLMVPALFPVVLSHNFLIPALSQDGRSRLAFECRGATVHQAEQDLLRPSSANRQSCVKFEGQKKSVSLRGQICVGRVEGRACLAEAHGCYCWYVGKAVA